MINKKELARDVNVDLDISLVPDDIKTVVVQDMLYEHLMEQRVYVKGHCFSRLLRQVDDIVDSETKFVEIPVNKEAA